MELFFGMVPIPSAQAAAFFSSLPGISTRRHYVILTVMEHCGYTDEPDAGGVSAASLAAKWAAANSFRERMRNCFCRRRTAGQRYFCSFKRIFTFSS